MRSTYGSDQPDTGGSPPMRDGASFVDNGQQGAAKTKSNLLQTPAVTLPKGGGALKSIDEKFLVNAVNATAAFSIPLPLTPARSGGTPTLSLNYNSGAGNGLFGIGWSCDYPSIQRRTDKKLPEYNDAEESDTFILSGAEDLVPELVQDAQGNWQKTNRYRPRIEGLFARIEKIDDTNGVYWRVTTRDNVVSIYGQSAAARVTSPVPGEEWKIFRWLLEYTYDDKGSITRYVYKPEDATHIAPAPAEKNRLNGTAPFANTYLKKVLYGNTTAFYNGDAWPADTAFLFELVFDYGEHDPNTPTTQEITGWSARQDPFSDYRAGFDIRTYRLCRRVLMFHHFQAELGWTDYLVRSLDFGYDESPLLTYLDTLTQNGFIWNTNGTLHTKNAYPPLAFTYRKPAFSREVKEMPADQVAGDPIGLDNQAYQWTDLYSEGVSGILSEQATGWFYKENLGDGNFTAPRLVRSKPSLTGLSEGTLAVQELEGNGKKYVVKSEPGLHGFYGLDEEDGWEPFTAFRLFPNIDFKDPNLKFIDLNGDGMPDLLVSRDQEFVWYAARGKLGYDGYRTTIKAQDEEKGPNILFSNIDKSMLVATADMTGDGLSDILVITNATVFYYPNLGYGRFGARVTLRMNGSFDTDAGFNPQFIYLADVDGTGTADIIYTGSDTIQVWFNQSGNSLKDPDSFFNPFPEIDDRSRISFVDLLGTGTSCLVWSSPLPASSRAPLRYIDLMNGKKPHLMEKYVNNLGKEITLCYTPSTHFYLTDKAGGHPWVTKLPFVVQCLSQVVTIDRVAQTRFSAAYTYHHGYYDPIEREFRGFARVEQTDTEEYDSFVLNTQGSQTTIKEKDFFQPKVTTVTWYHTGAYQNGIQILHQLEAEYYLSAAASGSPAAGPAAPLPAAGLAESLPPASLTACEAAEYCRSLKGLPLCQEVYGGDNAVPYTVSQYNYDVQMLQPKAGERYAVFLSHGRETLSVNLEQNPADPRILHTINVEMDPWGNVLQLASIAYGRKGTDASLPTAGDRASQSAQYITYAQSQYTNAIDSATAYRLPTVCAVQTWELNTGAPQAAFFTANEVQQRFATATDVPYEQATVAGQRRTIEHTTTLLLKDDLSGPLPFAIQETKALPFQNYLLAFTPTLTQSIYGAKYDDGTWRNQAMYVRQNGDNNYWIMSGTKQYGDLATANSQFYFPTAYRDNFGNLTQVGYDKYILLRERIVDAVGNQATVDAFNYRVVAPYLLRDMNDNRTGVRFDEFGRVIQGFVLGKEGQSTADYMDPNSVEASTADQPSLIMEYVFRYATTGLPDYAKSIAYEQYFYAVPDGKTQVTYTYSDGSGHEVMKKVQAAPGLAPQRNAQGQLVHDAFGHLQYADTSPDVRWIGSGRTIFNNKGNAVKQYEPFFDSSFEFTAEKEVVELGVTPVTTYDALGRVIRVDKPNGTFSKVTFDAWTQRVYDENDTVVDSSWYAARINGQLGEAEQQAAQKAAVHYNTPVVTYKDSLDRTFLLAAFNATQRTGETVLAEAYYTRSQLDIEGNVRAMTDARGNTVMTWSYDMLGNVCYQHSMDAGERWMLADVMGKPLRLWDSRQHQFNYAYDALHRPLSVTVNNVLYEQYAYGETAPNALANNLNGKVYQTFDTAGLITNTAYDCNGNPTAFTRQLLQDYKDLPAWDTNPALEAETFSSQASFDALNRPVSMTAPDGSVFTPAYDDGSLLDGMTVNIKGAATATPFVTGITYNANRQRETIRYGNNTQTGYTYDPGNYRLTRLLTTAGARILQDLTFTYDPAGNITRQLDNAQKTVFYGGQQVEATSDYYYDALYRLIEAGGREHTGQLVSSPQDNWNDNWCRLALQPNSPVQLRNYDQKYFYDSVGNLLKLQHIAGSTGSYTRSYNYNPGNNQLTRTTVGSQNYGYTYNEHGAMLSMPQLSQLQWNVRDELCSADLGGGGTAYYVYDTGGARVRKVIELQGNKTQERLYVGPFEVYRERTGTTLTLERQTLHVMDDKRRIAMIDTRTQGNDGTVPQLIRYQYGNQLGTACLELDPNARIITYEEFHPFGTTAYQATDASRQVPAKRYRYAGMERDEESGFNYHKERYYANWLGRWISADPIGLGDDPDLYAYAHNNPIGSADTNGMWIWVVAIVVGVLAGVLTSSPANAPERPDTPLQPRVSELQVVANVTMGVTAVVTAPAVLAHPIRAAATMAVMHPVMKQGHKVANRLDPSGNAAAALDIAVTVGGGVLATRARPLVSEPEPNMTPNDPPPTDGEPTPDPEPDPEGPPAPDEALPPEQVSDAPDNECMCTPANDNAIPQAANDNASYGPANDNASVMPAANDVPAEITPEQELAPTGTDGPAGPQAGGRAPEIRNMAGGGNRGGGRRSRGGDDENGGYRVGGNRRTPDRKVRTEDEAEQNTSSAQTVNLRDFFMSNIRGVMARAGKDAPEDLNGIWDRYTLFARDHQDGHFHLDAVEAMQSLENFVASEL